MIRDVASVTNVFIIGGDERIDLYKVNKVPHGTVSKVWYNSPDAGYGPPPDCLYACRI